MIGSSETILDYLEGSRDRFIIPVYQRKYSWKEEQCIQLYEDLKRIIHYNYKSHFFGSIVSSVVGKGNITEHYIIDGQQRLTTVTLLLLAIRNMVREGKIQPQNKTIDEEINNLYLISPYSREENKIKLRPVRDDEEALYKLFGDKYDYDKASKMTVNYNYFCRKLVEGDVTADDLYDAVGKLEIISITLEQGDRAQLIFESLNSTGLALAEGDKIRNYILMDLTPEEQNTYYTEFWLKIERCTRDDVSGFVRDYLSIKQQKMPVIDRVYVTFKTYAQAEEDSGMPLKRMLEDMLNYARLYEKLLTCESGLHYKELDNCLYRMKRLDIAVTRPFLMEVLRLNQDGKISVDDVLEVFLTVENYLFRRNICEVPTNALTKIFVTLNREILRYDNTTNDYVEKLNYALRSKRDSGRFPDDEEFAQALSSKQVYRMKGTYKTYLFERFENYGTKETKDFYAHLDNEDYSIEHIMPQHLTPAWRDALGPDAEEIHETWLHRLANLTLTGYNPNLSNKPFQEKRDAREGGYKHSGLRMNQKISEKDSWGLPELEERNDEMISQAKEIWKLPMIEYQPPVKEYESYTLDDEDVDLTGREIVKYSYQNLEQPVTSWTEMFSNIVESLHQKDHSVLSALAYDKGNGMDLGSYVSTSESDLRAPMKVDEQIYVEMNTSTVLKVSILRRLFKLYGEDPMDLVFYLRDENDQVSDLVEIRKKYWAYALPFIREKNISRGSFKNVHPTKSNSIYGFIGIGGINIGCVANEDEIRVELDLNKNDPLENKKLFDLLYSHKQEIESKLGVTLDWKRLNNQKLCWIGYTLKDVSIYNENDWQRMAEFHAEWSDKICSTTLPYLQPEKKKKEDRLKNIASKILEWTDGQEDVHLNPACCETEIIRFTTDGMSEILPEVENVPSGWHTANHYFYEIWNDTETRFNIKFVLSLENIPVELQAKIDRIRELYPDRRQSKGTNWPICYKTKYFNYGVDISMETIFSGLNQCMDEIRQFEVELKEKLANEGRRKEMAAVIQEWATGRKDIQYYPENSDISYIRFTTNIMDSILPDEGNTFSGWGTENHYFYEINNFSGNEVFIQLEVSAKGMTEEYQNICDRINEIHSVYIPPKWEFRRLYWTNKFSFGEDISKEAVWHELDQCMEEIRQFERSLKVQMVIWDWAEERKDIHVNFEKSNLTYLRFTTDAMNAIVPELKNMPSGWETDNHYFYEITKYSGTGFNIRFVLNSTNITEEFRTLCERINELYPAQIQKKDWVWRTNFKTKTFVHGEDMSRETIYSGLDQCMEEIRQFEADLKAKI